MNFKAMMAGAAIAIAAVISTAQASDLQKKPTETEFGKTLPPIGFVKFCATNPEDCKPHVGNQAAVAMTPDRWDMLRSVNVSVNAVIAPVSDRDLYGEDEHWTYPTDAGDCEDYVLLKKRNLEHLGFSPDALLITVVLDEKNEGHAILTIATDTGDYVLDNRVDDILRWNGTNYKFLKRQSHTDPLQWVALMKRPTTNSGHVTIGSNQ